MGLLMTGLVGFILIHSLPSITPLRNSLADRFGENRYRLLFALLSFAALVTIIVGMARAPFEPLWQPPAWGRNAALLIMPLAFISLVASGAPNNLKRVTRHPMLWGFVLWSAAHLLSNGDKASLILFGGLGLYSIYAMISQTLRGSEKSTLTQPLAQDIVTVAIGLFVYAVFLFIHRGLFGVALIAF